MEIQQEFYNLAQATAEDRTAVTNLTTEKSTFSKASGVIHQPPPQQGGGQRGTEYSSEKPTKRVQERKGGGIHPLEVISFLRRWRRQKKERQARTKIEKRGTGPPPHLVKHSILLET